MSEHYTFTADMTATVGAATKKTDYDKVAANTDEINERFNDHSALHENVGADEISVAGLSGELADDQPPKAHRLDGAMHTGADNIGNYVNINGSNVAQFRTPANVLSDIGAAASSHTHTTSDITDIPAYGGGDAGKVLTVNGSGTALIWV